MKIYPKITSTSHVCVGVSIVLAIIACTSLPTMATISHEGKEAQLILADKAPGDLLNIKQAIISADKKQLLIIGTDDARLVLDSTRGLIEDRKAADDIYVRQEMEPVQGGWYDDRNVLTKMKSSKDGLYAISMQNPDDPAYPYVTELATGRMIVKIMVLNPWYFGKDFRFAISTCCETSHSLLDFYNLKSGEKIQAYKIPRTKSTVFGSYKSMSSDSENKFLVYHIQKVVQIYNFNSGELVANLMFLDGQNWVLVSSSGQYDGTVEAIKYLVWKVGEENIKLSDFGTSFYKKGLLGILLGVAPEKQTDTSKIKLAKQLVGKIHTVNGRNILVGVGRVGENPHMGEKLFVIVDGRKSELNVTFPMMTSAKCTYTGKATVSGISPGMPVFK